MKYFIIPLAVTMLTSNVSAQKKSDEKAPKGSWKRAIQAGVNFNQSSFSENWKGGGVNLVSWNALLNSKAEYTDGKFQWTNDFQSQYGQNRTKDLGLRKGTDRLFYEGKASYKIKGAWNYFAAASFLSQFAAGYNYKTKTDGTDSFVLISSFMAPAFVTEAFGFEYKPADYFSVQFGLYAMRQTFVLNQDLYDPAYTSSNILYGVEKGKYYRNQHTFQLVANFDREVVKNVTLKARYMFVIDYQEMNDKGIVSRLDASLVAKVNKYLNVNFGTVLLYDYTQSGKMQYSQVLGVGLLYSLSNFEDKK